MKVRYAVVVLVGLGLLAVASCRPRSDAPARAADSQDFATSADGVPISFKEYGRGDISLVFVHGWCGDSDYWESQIPSFRVYYHVVTLDLAGHGSSGREREIWTIPAFARDVVAVVEKLDLDNVVLIGHSLGGPVILEACRLMPDRVIGLIGVETFTDIYMTAYAPAQIVALLALFRDDFAEGMRKYALENFFRSSASERFKKRIILDLIETPARVGMSALEELLKYDGTAALQECRVPIRSINADIPVLPFRTMRGHARDFTLKFMNGVGHFLMIEDPQDFNRILADFLGQIILASYNQEKS